MSFAKEHALGFTSMMRLDVVFSRSLIRVGSIVFGLGFILTAAANPFTVQIGAFAKGGAGFGDDAAHVGDVFTTTTDRGLRRVMIGRFTTIEDARAARAELRALGYADAFIKRFDGKSDPSAVAVPEPASLQRIEPVIIAKDPVTAPEPNDGASAKPEVVNLDGVPYLKDGDRFIPLD